MKNYLRIGALAWLCLPLLASAADGYDNQRVDYSILTVANQGTRDQIAGMMKEGEPFTALAQALSTNKQSSAGGRHLPTTCYDYPDAAFAKVLCTWPVDQPLLFAAKSDGWGILVIHARAKTGEAMYRMPSSLVKPGKPNFGVLCTPVAGGSGEPLSVLGDTVSHFAQVNKSRAYLKVRPTELTFLTAAGDLLTIDRGGNGQLQNLASPGSTSFKCQAPAAGAKPVEQPAPDSR